MLYEIRNVKQDDTGLIQQWFFDHEMDLLVWREKDGKIAGFQLCYNKQTNPHALTWFSEKGFRHNRIDYAEEKFGRRRGSPLLTPDGLFDSRSISEQFVINSRTLEKSLRSFVHNKLLQYKPAQ